MKYIYSIFTKTHKPLSIGDKFYIEGQYKEIKEIRPEFDEYSNAYCYHLKFEDGTSFELLDVIGIYRKPY